MSKYMQIQVNETIYMVFQATILHCKVILGQTTWTNEMNFIVNHAPGAGSINTNECTKTVFGFTILLNVQIKWPRDN